jgi:aspartate aminotransferase-like enzyme
MTTAVLPDRTRPPIVTMGSGPGTIHPSVAAAMARPQVHHEDPAFLRTLRDVADKLRAVLLTDSDVVLLEGEALLGLEAVAAAVVGPGDHCLNLVSGHYGKAFTPVLAGQGAVVTEVLAGYDDAIDVADVKAALDADPLIRFLAVVHSETPSCTINPIEEICRLAHERGVVTMVDAVSSAGGLPVRVDEWGIDFAVVGPQKCLGAAPGVAIVAVSARGWDAVRPEAVPGWSYLSLQAWRPWATGTGLPPYTLPVSVVTGLDTALDLLLDEGLEQVWHRHHVCAQAVRAGVIGFGLQLWAARPQIAADSCTGVLLPDGVDVAGLRALMRDKYRVFVSNGVDDLADRLIRIGHMGATAEPVWVLAALGALAAALGDLGVSVRTGDGIAAAVEQLRALTS